MLSRELLPQIPSEKHPEFIRFLRQNGVDVTLAMVSVDEIKPIQKHVNQDKIDAMVKDDNAFLKPCIVTKSGYILDGHHRWLAKKERTPGGKLLALVAHTTLKELIILGHKFDHSFTKTVTESTTYSRLLWNECNCEEDQAEGETIMVRKTLRPKYEA